MLSKSTNGTHLMHLQTLIHTSSNVQVDSFSTVLADDGLNVHLCIYFVFVFCVQLILFYVFLISGRRVRTMPAIEEVRVQHYSQLRRFLALPAHFVGLRASPVDEKSVFASIIDK